MYKFSIITCVLNAENTIHRCIESVFSQSIKKDIQFIVIDGKSTDRTLEYLKSREDKIDVLISESDKGIYDAINKGIYYSKGAFVGILHADDYYIHNEVLEKVYANHQRYQKEAYGYDINYVDERGKIIRAWKNGTPNKFSFTKGWIPAHTGFFVKKEIYNTYGYYDTNLQIAADYEMLFRLINIYRVKVKYIPVPIINMQTGGISNNKIRNIVKGNKEIIASWKKYNINFPYISYFFYKFLIRLLQWMK
jgi:glycosyltransferase involved in cell wall biosynthesis